MHERLAIETIYLIQEEDSRHFHLWLFPRYAWMKEFGTGINSVKSSMEWAKKNLNNADSLRAVEMAAAQLKI